MSDTKFCFVIMPFSSTDSCSEGQWTSIFNGVIKPAIEGSPFGYECRRSSASTGNLIKGIVQDLYAANLVVADLTDKRPNVFYELGVRHTLQHRTILISQRLADIPSDLHGYACLEYDWQTDAGQGSFTSRIRDILSVIESDPNRPDNPIADFLTDTSIRLFQFQRDENLRKLNALSLEFEVWNETLKLGLNDAKGSNPQRVSIPAFQAPALEHLLATQYVVNRDFNFQGRMIHTIILPVTSAIAVPDRVAALIEVVETYVRNIDRMIAAVESGNPVDEVEVEALKIPPSTPASADTAAEGRPDNSP